jgi:hypothetical protein
MSMPRLIFASSLPLLLGLTACSNDVHVQDGDGGGDGTGGSGSTTSVVVTAATNGSGGMGGGIGEPSDVYPAPHPDPPTVVNLGGPVMTSPVFIPVYFAGDDAALLDQLTIFSQKLGTTAFWAATTSEYGVGPASSLPPVQLTETAPAVIDDSEVQAWLAAKLNANDPAFPTPSINTLYAIYYPAGTKITMNDFEGGGSSCQEFGGYHSNIQLDAAHGSINVPYAVLPRCGNWGGFGGADALTIPSSHEFIEAASDPLPLTVPAYGQPDDDHVFWAFVLGGENADLCAQNQGAYTVFPRDIEYAVQRSWSNASAMAGHDPCVPTIPGQVYFAGAPVLEDDINLGQGFITKGISLAQGESKTIDVKLFSDGPTQPFSVIPDDVTYLLGAGGSLGLELDEFEGQNGQTLHLTVTREEPSQYGIEFFMLRAKLGNRENLWLGMVGN